VGFVSVNFKAPAGATENKYNSSFAPFRGLRFVRDFTHGCTVGYCHPLLRSFKQILKT
jgi:hypothetical protein